MNQQLEQNRKLTESFKGGVIMDVTNAKEAEIAQKAGAVAVMALERVPSDIRKQGGVARKRFKAQYPFPLWQKPESDILPKLRF